MATVPEVLKHPTPWLQDWHPAGCWAGNLFLCLDTQKGQAASGFEGCLQPWGTVLGKGCH